MFSSDFVNFQTNLTWYDFFQIKQELPIDGFIPETRRKKSPWFPKMFWVEVDTETKVAGGGTMGGAF